MGASQLGRWMSADPLEVHAPGSADANLYEYVSGAVLRATDPIGLAEAWEQGVGFGGTSAIENQNWMVEQPSPGPSLVGPVEPRPGAQARPAPFDPSTMSDEQVGRALDAMIGEGAANGPDVDGGLAVLEPGPSGDEALREASLDGVQAVLDGVSIGLDASGVGIVASAVPDLMNAGISAYRGHWGHAALSVVAAIPILGNVANASLLASRASRVCKGGVCGSCFVEGTEVRSEGEGVPIEALRVGDRVDAGNPDCAADYVPEDAAIFSLEMTNEGEPDHPISIQLLRRWSWLEESGLEDGPAWVDLSDAGAAGWAELVAIAPPPETAPGTGCLVTMTLQHGAREILELRLETGRALELTPAHPLYAEGIGWTPAGELVPGALLRTDYGVVAIDAINPAEPNRVVYNIEVGIAHTYRVGAEAVWAHNSCFGAGRAAARGSSLKPEAGYLRGKRHGIKQQPGDAMRLAREEGKPHGVWGNKADLAHAGEQASTLSPGQMADFPIRPGSKSVVYNPDGSTSVPNMIRVRNNGDGTFHGFPIDSTTAGPIVQ
jgi:hypothetical protein